MHNLNIFGVEINFRECKADIKLAQVGFHLYTAHWMSPIQFTPLFELHVLSIWSALDLQREEAKQEILEGTNAKSHLFKMNQTRATLARTQCGQVFIIYKRKMLLTSRVEKADWLKLSIEIYSDANSVFFFFFSFLIWHKISMLVQLLHNSTTQSSGIWVKANQHQQNLCRGCAKVERCRFTVIMCTQRLCAL